MNKYMDNFMVNYVQQTIKNEVGQLFTGEQILSVNERILISGVAGSGKTTLCQYLHNLLLKNHTQSCLIKAKCFSNMNFQEFLENEINFKSEKIENVFYIIIDGLDEIYPDYYQEVTLNIANFFAINQKYRAIVTSRPSVNFDCFYDFEKCELQSLNQADIHRYIKAFLQEKEAIDFINATESNKLEIKNPLLLALLLNAFNDYGALPNSIYRTIELSVEQLLSSWDSSKNIFARSNNSLGSNIETLSLLAYYLELNEQVVFSISDFQNVYKSENYKETLDVLSYFVQSAIIVNEGFTKAGGVYSFIHKNFQEYFLIKYFQDYFRIEQKFKKILHFKSHILELILESENTDAVSNYISHTDIKHSDIIYKIVDLFNCSNKNKTQSYSKNVLKKEWGNLIKQQNRLQKGNQLESFSANFLSAQFEILNKKLRTHNGEIDIVVENKSNDPFWNEFGTDYFVECKFWSKKVPLREIFVFSKKVENSNIKLGFYISLSGFTKDALHEFENTASKIIVPITQGDISEYLSDNRIDPNEFFKKLVRKMKLKKKY